MTPLAEVITSVVATATVGYVIHKALQRTVDQSRKPENETCPDFIPEWVYREFYANKAKG